MPRHQRTIRLFGFELAVVMIGVLAAQQISSWAQNRSSISQVEDVHRDLFHSFAVYRAIARADQAALPCLSERVQLLMRAASSGRPVDRRLLVPAPLMGMSEDSVSADNERLLRQRYGEKETDKIMSVEFSLRAAGLNGAEIDRGWHAFERLDDRFGQVTDNDRAATRQVAVELLGSIESLKRQANAIISLTAQLGIPTNDKSIKPVASCDIMWRTQRAFAGSTVS